MLQLEYDHQSILETIDKIVEKTFSMDMPWDWPCGVAYYGICEAYYATGNKTYIEKLRNWVDEYIELGLPEWTVNTCAMGHTLITLYEVTGEEKYWNIVEQKLDYLEHRALRFGEGVLQHTVSSNNDFPEQAWADTLFMAAFFMLRAGVVKGNETLIQDALNQYHWHITYLQNRETAFWYHGYNHIGKDHMSGLYWGRANAWAAYTMSQVKKRLPEAYLYPLFMELNYSLRDQLAALKFVQTENGLWRTILDDIESYEEVSASSGIAAAMVVNGNILYQKYIQKAMNGVLANVSSDGSVLNVSGGTAIMKNREGYKNVPIGWNQGWGQGLALAFLSDILTQSEPVQKNQESEE